LTNPQIKIGSINDIAQLTKNNSEASIDKSDNGESEYSSYNKYITSKDLDPEARLTTYALETPIISLHSQTDSQSNNKDNHRQSQSNVPIDRSN